MNIQITHFKSQSFLHYFKQRNQTLIFEFERFPLLFDFSASLNFLKFDVTSKVWPFESESFDFVFSCLVLEHLPGAGIGSNKIHVTPLQYSVTFLVLLMVFNYIFDTGHLYLFNYFCAIVFVIVIEYFLQYSVLMAF